MKSLAKPYRIIGAYDSETTNINENGEIYAFPILHQLGLTDGTPVEDLSADNVEGHVNIELYRHSVDLFARLDELMEDEREYTPVILCHNLAFDMYGLSPWLSRHDVRVLAKSARKPITFTVRGEDGRPALVIWDTLVFAQQSLERMGEDCGYHKATGEWDYNLVRTPNTPLTETELDYAKRDVYALLAWFGWWLRRNPDIQPGRLGLNVVTKTGVVRERRRVRFDQLHGDGMKWNIGRMFMYTCRDEQAKSDDELFTYLACTRGGFTFCSSKSASVPYDLSGTDEVVAAFDAVSQHPAQLVSHRYPVRFREMPPHVLEAAFVLVGKVTIDRILKMWEKPFPVAFCACFEFVNLRPRRGSVFERFGVFPLASARYRTPEQVAFDEDNGDRHSYIEEAYRRNYHDVAVNAECAFGKVVRADRISVYLTELAAWEVWQAYEWDEVRAIHGYETGRFARPTDMDVVSVMRFYQAKNAYKAARGEYAKKKTISEPGKLLDLGIPPAIVDGMVDGTVSSGDVDAVYMGLKADLNSIFGISASNMYRRPTELGEDGIEYVGDFGVCNAPKNPKVWYQFGQRIVGWSRIAQIIALELVSPFALHIVNGDTDSVKAVVRRDDLTRVERELLKMGNAIDEGKRKTCSRVRRCYPDVFDELEGIGHYELEFTTERFCASWNKAYCEQTPDRDGKLRFSFTLAGIPTRRRERRDVSFIGINGLADRLYGLGWSFEDICNLFLGYNVTFSYETMKLNGRKFPKWGETVYSHIVDYQGKKHRVAEPAALALYPMTKTVNDTRSHENAINLRHAFKNNPHVNIGRKLIWAGGVLDLEFDDGELL